MNVADINNCKRLYELSAWGDKSLEPIYGDLEQISTAGHYARPVIGFAYDSGYLLRKLPRGLDQIKLDVSYGKNYLYIKHFDDFWVAGYKGHKDNASELDRYYFSQTADTPEDALTLLAIKLFEAGVLK